MRVRSYEFYELRIGKFNDQQELRTHGTYEHCRKVLDNEFAAYGDTELTTNYYIVRVQLMQAWKKD